MKIKVESGDITQHGAKAIIVNLFEGVTRPAGGTGAVDNALNGGISNLIADGEIKGKAGEITVDPLPRQDPLAARPRRRPRQARRTSTSNSIRNVTGTSLRRARATGATSVATILHGAGIAGLDPEACAQAIAEGAIMGAYRFRRYKKGGDEAGTGHRDPDDRRERQGEAQEDRARHPARHHHGRGSKPHPRHGERARERAHSAGPGRAREDPGEEAGLQCEVLNENQLTEMGMGALLGVGVGSAHPCASSSSATRATRRASARPSASSARASPSTPAASRSSPPPAWSR